MQQQGAPSEEASAADLTTEGGDSAELEAPLLSPTSAGTSPRGRSSAHLRRSSALTIGSSSGAEEDALPSRRGSVDRQLGKWGSSEFEAESPFWPASRKAGGRAGKVRAVWGLQLGSASSGGGATGRPSLERWLSHAPCRRCRPRSHAWRPPSRSLC